MALDRAEAPLADSKETDLRLQEMGRDAIQRQPSLARSRSEAEKTESRTRNNVQGGRETTSSPGRETTVHFALEVDAKQRPYRQPKRWTRNNVHI